MNRNFDK